MPYLLAAQQRPLVGRDQPVGETEARRRRRAARTGRARGRRSCEAFRHVDCVIPAAGAAFRPPIMGRLPPCTQPAPRIL